MFWQLTNKCLKTTMERVELIFDYCLWMGELDFTKTFDITLMLNFVWWLSLPVFMLPLEVTVKVWRRPSCFGEQSIAELVAAGSGCSREKSLHYQWFEVISCFWEGPFLLLSVRHGQKACQRWSWPVSFKKPEFAQSEPKTRLRKMPSIPRQDWSRVLQH